MTTTTLVLTVIGDDRAGLVNSLSDVVAAHDGNWERSEMSELAGKFAGIVLVTVPDQQAAALVEALGALTQQGILDVRTEFGASGSPGSSRRITLDLIGTDRAGIVRDISRALAARGVSIETLRTGTRDAPMAGGTLFEAHATLEAPGELSLDDLRSALEALADELMVDIELTTETT
jgi:glycine cleavage system regulatory protein